MLELKEPSETHHSSTTTDWRRIWGWGGRHWGENCMLREILVLLGCGHHTQRRSVPAAGRLPRSGGEDYSRQKGRRLNLREIWWYGAEEKGDHGNKLREPKIMVRGVDSRQQGWNKAVAVAGVSRQATWFGLRRRGARKGISIQEGSKTTVWDIARAAFLRLLAVTVTRRRDFFNGTMLRTWDQ
jgi:hypothetical protein